MSDILTIKCCAIIPSATPTPTNTITPTITSSPTITPSITASPTITPSHTATPTITPSNTVTPTITPSNTVTPTITPSITASPSITPSITPSNSLTPTITPSNSLTPTITPSNSLTPTITPSNTVTPTITPSITPSPSVTPSITPSPSVTPSITPSNSLTPTITPSNSLTPTRTPTKTPTPTPPPQWQQDFQWTIPALSSFSTFSKPQIHISSDGVKVAVSTDSTYYIIRGNNDIYELSGSDTSQYSDITGSSDGQTLIASRSNGLLSRSYNRGASWSNLGLSKNWRAIVSNNDTSKIYGVVNNEYIYYSHNSGSSFTVTNNDIPRLWKTLDIIEAAGFTTIYAAATSDYIYKGIQQLDGSFVWSTLTSAGSRDWTQLAVAKNSGTIVACSNEGVYKSTNGGTSWTNILIGNMLSIGISNDGNKIIVNTSGSILYTSLNGGTTWSSESLGYDELAVTVNPTGTKFVAVGFYGVGGDSDIIISHKLIV